jgi:hypothetical protein
MHRFSDLNPVGRAIIVTVAALTAAVAAVAFATSYGALYAFIKGTGLYDDTGRYADRLNQAWPLLLDAAFIIAQLAAILGGILRGSRGWPILTMLVSGSLTVWFNLQHAGTDPGRRLAAALPPILMMLAFEIDVQIVKWVMRALGKPMEAGTALSPVASPAPYPGAAWAPPSEPVYGAMWPPLPDGPGGYVQPGVYAPSGMHNPQVTERGTPQNGHGSSKREQVEQYLAALSPQQLAAATGKSVTAELTASGVPVNEQYVGQILGQWRTTVNGHRKRGSSARHPPR